MLVNFSSVSRDSRERKLIDRLMRFGSPLGFVGNYFRIHRNQGTHSAVGRIGECTQGCGVSTLEKPMKATPKGFCSTPFQLSLAQIRRTTKTVSSDRQIFVLFYSKVVV